MTPKNNPANLLKRVLSLLLILLGLGGLGGGIAMLLDPSGQSMGLPRNLLENLFIDTFLLPGLFLIIVMGLLPLITAFGLGKFPRCPFFDRVNPLKSIHWSWSLSFGLGLVLIFWIAFQILLWGSPLGIQLFYLGLGFLIFTLSLLGIRGETSTMGDDTGE
jgi:hypothetical protein